MHSGSFSSSFYFGVIMNITIDPTFPAAANIGLTSIAIVLNDLFKKYEQPTSLLDACKVSKGFFVLPFLVFQEKRIHLKGTSSKKVTKCSARLIAYSKKPDINDKAEDECLRFIHANRCYDKEEIFKQIPNQIREAHFDEDGEATITRLLDALGGIKADKVSYYYSACVCDGAASYRIAVVHDFGTDKPYCTVTSYIVINGEK